MDYIIYAKKDDDGKESKRVKFEDGTDFFVNKTNEGMEYFPVPNNIRYNPENSLLKKLFTNRIKDAVDTIKQGDGDFLIVRNLFGRTEIVYRFVDREYGENIRKQTIEGFKDAEFGYSLKFRYNKSISGYNFISKDKTILSVYDNQNNYIYFDTEEASENFKNEILNKANKIAEEYSTIAHDEEKSSKYLKNMFATEDIFSEVGLAIIENKKWTIDVVQVINQK